jgi:hypothetical protein
MSKLLFPFRFGAHLYAVGVAVILLGCLLVIPTVARVEQFWQDPMLFLGATILMNGITIILFGIILLAFGQIVSLLNRISNALVWYQASNSEERILIKCPKCDQQLRALKGKRGILTCPKCETQFEAKT